MYKALFRPILTVMFLLSFLATSSVMAQDYSGSSRKHKSHSKHGKKKKSGHKKKKKGSKKKSHRSRRSNSHYMGDSGTVKESPISPATKPDVDPITSGDSAAPDLPPAQTP